MIKPHGGKLVNRVVSEETKAKYEAEYKEMPQLVLNDELIEDVQNIAQGVFSPLEGFMGEADVNAIIKNDRLANDLAWTMAITLDVSDESAAKYSEGDEIALVDAQNQLIGIMNLEEKFTHNKKAIAEKAFQTLDMEHPGVAKILNSKNTLLGGKIQAMPMPISDYQDYTFYPAQTRKIFEEKGWKTVVGFQTRNVPHLGHEYVQKAALTVVDGLFINPIIGKKKAGDFLDPVILGSYDMLFKHYYRPEHATMGILRTRMRYGGPKEAIFHAIMRKNFGCTHFIVGRDHAGVGDYYGPFDAHFIFDEFPDLGISPIKFRSFYICNKCGGVVNDKICPHDGTEFQKFIAGRRIRSALSNHNSDGITDFMRPEIIQYLLDQDALFVE